MLNFIFGDDQVKVNNFISEFVKKNNFQKSAHELTEDNISELVGIIDTPSLFGDKNLYIIDVTNSEFETLEKFISSLDSNSDVFLLYEGEIDKRSKEYKLLSKIK